ncbi:MAG: hypothetical protein HKN31_08660, partial [Pricia sp.]|nr:hypothetical protein [Pricia sp.]
MQEAYSVVKKENSIKNRVERLSSEERRLLLLKTQQYLAQKSVNLEPQSSNRLVAYVIANGKFDSDGLKSILRTKVPEYMVPSKIIKMDKFPVLPNGKVDRKALVRLGRPRLVENGDKSINSEPTTETESKLLTIWEQVLNATDIGIHDNFFGIGGDSILSIQVIAKAKSAGISLSPNQLFEHQTIKELAEFLERKKETANTPRNYDGFNHLVAIQQNGHKPPLFCLHSGGSHFFFYNLFASYIDPQRPVYALQASRHEGEITVHTSVKEMAVDFVSEIKKIYPEGPYHFVSYCFNTAIGFEMIRILNSSSEKANLIIADTMADYLSLFALSRTKVRIRAFLGRLTKHPIKTIYQFIAKKFIRKLTTKLKNLTSTGSQRVIQKLHNNHIQIYRNYDWQPLPYRIHLLLTEKKVDSFNEKIIESWKKVSRKG